MAFEIGPDGLYHIQLTANDERLGKLNADGSIARWPAVTVFGAKIDRNTATIQGVEGGFVVVPPNMSHLLDIVTVSAAVPGTRKADKTADKAEA